MFFNFFKEKVLILLNLYFIMPRSPTAIQGVHTRNFNPFRLEGVSINRSHKRIRPERKISATKVVQRIAVPRGTKIPFRVGTKEFRLAQELRRIAGTKVSPSQSKADVYAVLASLRKKSSLRYLKKSDVFIGRDVEAVFKTLVENKVIIYSPLGIKK